MLRTSLKSRRLFQVKKNKRVEFANNIFKIAAVWFRSEFKYKSQNLPFIVVDGAVRFIKNMISGLLNFLAMDANRLLNYYKISKEMAQFYKAAINFNKMVTVSNSDILTNFYKMFIQFYWLVNPLVIQINTVTNEDIEKDLFVKIYHPVILSYLYDESQNFIHKSTKIKTICFISGRGRSVLRAFKLSRFKFRELIIQGMFIGVTRSSW